MADTKISGLPAASTPLDSADIIPVVQENSGTGDLETNQTTVEEIALAASLVATDISNKLVQPDEATNSTLTSIGTLITKELNLLNYSGADKTGAVASDDAMANLWLDAEIYNAAGYKVRTIIPSGNWQFTKFHKYQLFDNLIIENDGIINIPAVANLYRWNGATYEAIAGAYETPNSNGIINTSFFVNEVGGLHDVTFIGGEWISEAKVINPFQLSNALITGTTTPSTEITIRDYYAKGVSTGILASQCSLQIDNTEITETGQNAIFARYFNYLGGSGNRGSWIGVDPASPSGTWTNVAYFNGWGGQNCNSFGAKIYITGGTAFSFSGVNNRETKNITLDNVTVEGAGLSAISVAGRLDATTGMTLRDITLKNCKVRGFGCAPDADLHDAIAYGSQAVTYAESVVIDNNIIDCCAPWESYDSVNFEIQGTLATPGSGTPYNVKKTAGTHAVGGGSTTHFGSFGITGKSVNATIGGTRNIQVTRNIIRNVPTGGISAQYSKDGVFAGNIIKDCGWERDGSDNATTTIQAGIDTSLGVNINVQDNFVFNHAEGVNQNNLVAPYVGQTPINLVYDKNAIIDPSANIDYGIVLTAPSGNATQMGYDERSSVRLGYNYSKNDSFEKLYFIQYNNILEVYGDPVTEAIINTSIGTYINQPHERYTKMKRASVSAFYLQRMQCYKQPIYMENVGTNNVNIITASSETINGTTPPTIYPGEKIRLQPNEDNTDWDIYYYREGQLKTLTDGAPITWDAELLHGATVTLNSATGTRELSAITNGIPGHTYRLLVKQDGTGGANLTFASAYKFSNTYTVDTAANAVDILEFYYESSSNIHVSPVSQSTADIKKITEVDAATYTIQGSDMFIAVDYTATGAVTLTLPTATSTWDASLGTGQTFTIKDSGANAATFNIIINRQGTDTIVNTSTGETSVTIASNGGSIDITTKDANTWMVT